MSKHPGEATGASWNLPENHKLCDPINWTLMCTWFPLRSPLPDPSTLLDHRDPWLLTPLVFNPISLM